MASSSNQTPGWTPPEDVPLTILALPVAMGIGLLVTILGAIIQF